MVFIIFFTDRIYSCLFGFLSNLVNLHIIHLDLDLIKDKINLSHWCFWSNLISIKWFKRLFNNFNCVIINHKFNVLTLWMHYVLFIILFRRNKIIAIVNWIFYISDFLRSFMIIFNYGQILLSYSSIDIVFVYHLYFHIQNIC